MFNYKKSVAYSFKIFFILLCMTALMTFIIDPMQHYRKASFYKPYSFEQRYMVWGLLKNYTYDSVILGGSMTENFIKSNVDEELDLNVLKAPIMGGSAYEDGLMMQSALKNKDLKKIIFSFDTFTFKGSVTYNKNLLPKYLMNTNIFDDYKYLLNFDNVFKNNIKILVSNLFGIKKEMINYNKFYSWQYKNKFSEEIAINDYKQRSSNLNYEVKNYQISKLKENFEKNILIHIQNNQSVEFNIFFPPYSILAYKYFIDETVYKELMDFKEYVLYNLVQFNNVKVYDFQVASEITHNLDNYKDITHYSEDINKWIIQKIKTEDFLITKDNYQIYMSRLKQQVKAFNKNVHID